MTPRFAAYALATCLLLLRAMGLLAQPACEPAMDQHVATQAALARGDMAALYPAAQAAYAGFTACGWDSMQGRSLSYMAYWEMSQGDYALAGQHFRQVMAHYQAAGLDSASSPFIGALNNLAALYAHQDQHAAALDLLETCLRLAPQAPDLDSSYLANIYFNAGDACIYLGAFAQADSLIRASTRILQAHLGPEHPRLVLPLSGLGRLYLQAGLVDEAVPLLQEVVALQTQHGALEGGDAQVYARLGMAYLQQGRHEKALDHYRLAARAQARQFGTDNPAYARILLNLGQEYLALDQPGPAGDSLRRGLAIMQARGSDQDLAYAWLVLAQWQEVQGDLEGAWRRLEAIGAAYAAQPEVAPLDWIYLWERRTQLQLQRQDLGAAQACLDSLFSRHRALDQPESWAHAYQLRAQVAQARGEWEPAWAALDTALQSLQVPGAPSGTWHAQAQALRVLEAQASLAAAAPAAAHWERRRLVALRRAGETLEAASRAYAHPSERGRWLAAHAHLFPQAVAAVWGQAGGQPDPAAIQEAFDLAERARAMNLRQHLLEVEAQHGAGLPPALRAEGQALRREIALLRHQGTADPDQAWQRAERERQYDWWVTHLRQRFPAFEALYDPAPAREVPLASDQALVTFVATPAGWFRFVRIEDRLEMTRLSLPVAAVDSLVRQCCTQIEARQAAWQETGYALYQTLLGDVEFPAPVKRLVLVPEGSLCALPWEVLPTAPSEAGDIPFLVRRFALSYRYAAQLAGRSQAGWSFHRPALLAVQPDFGPGDSLPPLAGAGAEVAAILDIWPGHRLVGTAASEAALRAQAPGFGLIHIATHGLLADAQPWQSRLALAAGGDGAGVDGRLHLYELLDWSLRAELVTLSACHTGTGSWVEGEGVMSLARGFAYAGASSVVMSLWAVPDGPTAELMPAFYAGLKAGLPKDEALRQARLAYLASQPPERQHPYYWGAWVLTGDTAPLSRPLPWGWLAGGLLLIGLGAYGLRARRRAVAGPAGHSSPYGRPNRPG